MWLSGGISARTRTKAAGFSSCTLHTLVCELWSSRAAMMRESSSFGQRDTGECELRLDGPIPKYRQRRARPLVGRNAAARRSTSSGRARRRWPRSHPQAAATPAEESVRAWDEPTAQRQSRGPLSPPVGKGGEGKHLGGRCSSRGPARVSFFGFRPIFFFQPSAIRQ
jgi:hypothetical protein